MLFFVFVILGQDISEANRINYTKKKSTHTAGTKSFARNREEWVIFLPL